MMASGVYAIPKIEIEVTAVVTNTTPTGPVRGAGRPEATQMLERAIDLFAAELSLDPGRGPPAELHPQRRVPVHDRRPAPTTTSATTRARSTWRSRAPATTSCAASRPPARATVTARQLGIGVSAYVEITNGISESEFGARRDHRRRRGDRPDRLVLPGPGPRDDVRADRLRAARASRSRRSR